MRNQLTAALALVVAAASCTTAPTSTPTPTSDTASDVSNVSVGPEPDAATEPSTVAEPDTTTANTNADVDAAPVEATGPSGEGEPLEVAAEGAVVDVETVSLPAVVVDAVRSGGGELADTAVWTGRYSDIDLPVLDGVGVRLIEANLTATATSGGWQRLDEMQWLLNAPGTTRDEILTELADAAGVTGWEMDEQNSLVDAAECVQRDYSSAESGDRWTLQGCQYPTYPGMVAIGISRSATTGTAGAAPLVDPSVADVADAVDGAIERVTVTFGAPATRESTATLVTETDVSTVASDPADALAATALANWTRSNDEGGAVVFTGAPGSRSVVVNDSARFTSEGRLEP